MTNTTTQTYSTSCPGGCGGRCNGELVEVKGLGSKTAKTVRFAPCSYLLKQGWTGPQLAVFQADAARYMAW